MSSKSPADKKENSEEALPPAPPPPYPVSSGSQYTPPAPTGPNAPQGYYYPYGQPSPYNVPGYGAKILPPGSPSNVVNREYAGKWHDVWAAIIFLIHFIAVQAVTLYLAVKGFQNSDYSQPSTETYQLRKWVIPLTIAVVTGLIFSWLWLQLVKLAPKFSIYFALWWGVVFSAALGVLFLINSDNTRFVGIILILAAVLQFFYALAVRPRIPFAAVMLRKSVQVIKRYNGTVWVSYLALLVSLEWILIWLVGVSGAASLTNSVVVIFFLLISLYWTMEVIRNTVHVTTAGTVATYYFQKLNMPSNPTVRSLKRAITTSFGSICLGSFIVAFLQSLRNIVAIFASENQDSLLACMLASCAECILSVLESIIRYLNKWAYVQVAVYGKPFVRAARDTWDLFTAQGFHLIINDDLTSGALFMGCFFGGLITAFITGVYTYSVDENIAVSVAVIAFFIGYFLSYITMAVVESAVTTYYVCYAEDPATLERNDPEFFQAIRARHTFLLS